MSFWPMGGWGNPYGFFGPPYGGYYAQGQVPDMNQYFVAGGGAQPQGNAGGGPEGGAQAGAQAGGQPVYGQGYGGPQSYSWGSINGVPWGTPPPWWGGQQGGYGGGGYGGPPGGGYGR
jgi:hypothetical protein